jgi:hypothetical protein
VLCLSMLAAVVAGCISPDDTDLKPLDLTSIHLAATPHGGGHDHKTPGLHNASLHIEALSWQTGHDSPATYGEIDARGDLIATAILHQADGLPAGFFLVSAEDPTDLKVLGKFTDFAPTVYVADIKLSPDAQWVFVAAQRYGQIGEHLGVPDLPIPLDVPSWPNTIVDAGVYIFDVSDPTYPRLAGFHAEQYRGVHMMYVHEIDGKLYAFLQSTAYPSGMCAGIDCLGNLPPFADKGSRVTIAEFVVTDVPLAGEAATLVPPQPSAVASLVPVAEYAGVDRHSIHDMTVYDDPETGKTLMYVAHWDAGIRVVDVTDAANGNVAEIGAWAPEEFLNPETQGRIHTVMVDWIDGRRIIVATPEFPYWHEVPPVYILDGTDLSNIEELARWTIPNDELSFAQDDEDTGLYRFSPHNFNFHDGIVYLAHFHAGVWVLDLNADPANPEILAYTLLEPAETGPGALGGALADSPSVWDVVWHNDALWASDINSGLYSLMVPRLNAPTMEMVATEIG